MNVAKVTGTFSPFLRTINKFVAFQEGGLEASRFIQDTTTNLAPKALFARSRADLAETSFLELAESFLVYFGPKILGENVFRKLYSKKLPEILKDKVAQPAVEILQDKVMKSEDAKKLLSVKSAISLSGLAIPLTEYSLNYIKNLLTLKMFKKADFNNIAALDKADPNRNKENDTKQEKVKRNAKRNIATAGSILAGLIGLSLLIVKKQGSSKILNHISEAVLAPGTKFFPDNAKKANFFNKYFGLDFANKNGKLSISHGQLTSCVVAGAFGYLGAAKDRGKQNFLEVLFRYPLVGFYVITGSELFEKGFTKLLKNKGKCAELFSEGIEKIPAFKQLPDMAEKIADSTKGNAEGIYKNLCKQKAIVTMVPFVFSMLVMGLFVAGMSRLFTQFRYDKDKKQNLQSQPLTFGRLSLDEFKNKVKA